MKEIRRRSQCKISQNLFNELMRGIWKTTKEHWYERHKANLKLNTAAGKYNIFDFAKTKKGNNKMKK